MKLYVQHGDESSSQWKRLCEIDLKLGLSLHPHSFTKPQDLLGLNLELVVLPNGEHLKISVAYSTGNRGVSIRVVSEDRTLLHIGGFKSRETSYDPDVIFLTPKGLHVSLMVGY